MLSNHDIESISKSYKLPLKGVYLRDRLPAKILPGFYVCNLDNSSTTDGTSYGTHWTAIVCDQMNCVYFDSFGCVPPPEVDRFIKTRYPKYGYNAWICQDMRASTCGFWCVAMALRVFHRRPPGVGLQESANDFVNLFREAGNEATLREFFRDGEDKCPDWCGRNCINCYLYMPRKRRER